MKKKIVFFVLFMLTGIMVFRLQAQQASKKKAVHNSTVQAQDAGESRMDSPAFFSFPQFYSFWPAEHNDTVLKYICYAANDSLLNVDTFSNVSEIKHIILIKTYTDYTHTYVDAEGKPQPMPVNARIYRYDRSGTDKWIGQDYQTKEYSYFREIPDEIVRTDTTVNMNPATGNRKLTIRKYYRVEPTNP
jgi:hypothetical protein